MAKILLPPNRSLDELADELAPLGITLDRHPLPDGSFRVYVRRSNLQTFLKFLNL